MSDARLRELERLAASGELDARARLLLERERLGQVTRERVALAAHAGDPAARRALDLPAEDGLDLLTWARGFYAFGQHACVRVVAAAVRASLPRNPQPPAALAAFEALGPWLACPCDSHAAPVVKLSRARALELPCLPGALLGLAWDQGPAAVLRTFATREEAERARPAFEAAGGVTDVAPVAAGGFALRLRECFFVRRRVLLIRELRALAACSLAWANGVIEGVNAVPRAASADRSAREAISRALIQWALDPASR